MPLILPVHVVCNTSDEDLHRNIKENSRRPGAWINTEPAHDGVAVLCGSGPSLAESVAEIADWQRRGGTVFAMNGAAKYLHGHGIMPDHQVIIDPRPVTAELVGPARDHLFASQVHPDCFKAAPHARVWHLQIEGIDDLLPEYPSPFCLLGGAASVGNTACCLAYALGYRTLHIYGYDSCHRGAASHAFRQPMNDGDPCARVMFGGKEYTASLTMKMQAEKFQITGRALQAAGCEVVVHGEGLLPDIWNAPPEKLSEVEKYERLWALPAYRIEAPGERHVAKFLSLVRPTGTVIDFGSGTGRAGAALAKAGLDVILVDFAANCRDPETEVAGIPFLQFDVTEPMPLRSEYGYCTDVLEHIAPDKVDGAIRNIMTSAATVFFQVSTVPDVFGGAINQTLHLTVQPSEWWQATFKRLGYRIPYVETTPDAVVLVATRSEA